MRNAEYIELDPTEIAPDIELVQTSIYYPDFKFQDSNFITAFQNATTQFIKYVKPVGIILPISYSLFSEVYKGIGLNTSPSPLENIVSMSQYLHLFAATLGSTISNRIDKSFEGNDYLNAYILNTVASIATDLIAIRLGQLVNKNEIKTISYSPGYCGWHVSGQHALFRVLNPDKIGISLNKEALMTPIKSISGVLVTGEPSIHKFVPNFSFCKECKDNSCLPRMKS